MRALSWPVFAFSNDDHNIAGSHDAFHCAADCDPWSRKRQGRITGILFIDGKHTEQPAFLADGALTLRIPVDRDH